MELINLTPHVLAITSVDGRVVELSVGGPAVRVVSATRPGGTLVVDGAEVRVTLTPALGEVVHLPDPVSGRFLVVSRVVAEACPQRVDLLFPDELIRDAGGNVVGCAALSSVHPGVTEALLVRQS